MNPVVCNKQFCLRFARIEEILRGGSGLDESALSARELAEYQRWKTPERQQAYLASRVLLKEILCTNELAGDVPVSGIEILSRSQDGLRGTAPSALFRGEKLPVKLSIAHTKSMVLAGVSPDWRRPFGVDLVRCEPVNSGFRRLWFGPEEQAAFESFPEDIWLRGWAVKEAAFKAVGGTSRFAPREIQAFPVGPVCWRVRFSDRPTDPLTVRSWKTHDHILACTCENPLVPIDSPVDSEIDEWNVPALILD